MSTLFEGFPKIARLSRECVITEKIDGTNAQVFIVSEADLGSLIPANRTTPFIATVGDVHVAAGSRTRWITPERDNFGFARWVLDHAEELVRGLGEGRHFGEWWGSGIQRGYGLTNGEKRFSLFNVGRWGEDRNFEKYPDPPPACCRVVPALYGGVFTTAAVDVALEYLRLHGSAAAPGFPHPEGLIVWHQAAGVSFKKTLEKDEEWKGGNR